MSSTSTDAVPSVHEIAIGILLTDLWTLDGAQAGFQGKSPRGHPAQLQEYKNVSDAHFAYKNVVALLGLRFSR